MMTTDLQTTSYSNGEIQRWQIVRLTDWNTLDFFCPHSSDKAFQQICRIYQDFLVPACPWIFGRMVLFCLPEDFKFDFPLGLPHYGELADSLTAAAVLFREEVRFMGKQPAFFSPRSEALWRELEKQDCLRIIAGRRSSTKIIPVSDCLGFLSETENTAQLKANCSFFIMDCFDCATPYDHVGEPFGLCVKNGTVMSPPLYRREALLVQNNGDISVEIPDLRNLEIEIRGKRWLHRENASIFMRPAWERTGKSGGVDHVIIGNKVVGVHRGGWTLVPAAGFVLRTKEQIANAGDAVIYHGMEQILFAIQAGNSIIRNGVRTTRFLSSFYNVRNPLRTPYPPSLYPLNYAKDRAARMAIGNDKNGKPMLIWAEGAGKLRYEPGKDSRGATLEEVSLFCQEAGMINGVSLDGGGSAQILIQNKRAFRISDRQSENNLEMERAVPMGLIWREP